MIKGLKFTQNVSLQLILTTYVLLLPILHMFYCIHSKTSYNQFRPVFCVFFAVPVHSSCILRLSGTSLVRGPSKKGNRTETRLDFKALPSATSPSTTTYSTTTYSTITYSTTTRSTGSCVTTYLYLLV